MSAPHLAVVGGGFSGLVAAYTLRRLAPAATLTLIEPSERLGGKVQTLYRDGFVIETGPDSLLTRKPAALELIRELELDDELVPQGATGSGAYVSLGGRLIKIPAGAASLVPDEPESLRTSGLLSKEGYARFLREPEVPPKVGDDDESLGDFVRRRFGDELLVHLAEPLFAGIHAGVADDLSLTATLPQWRELEHRYGSLTAARAARAAAERTVAGRTTTQAGVPSAAQAGPPFVALKGGFARLIERLIERTPGLIALTHTAATALAPTAGGFELVLSDGHTLAVDGVILAVPATVAARLCAWSPEAASLLVGIPYAGVAGVVLAFSGDPLGELAGSGYVARRTDGSPVTACTWVHRKWPHTAPPGTSLFRLHIGHAGDPGWAAAPDDELLAVARAELHRTLGIADAPLFSHIYRWTEALPQYRVGHTERTAAIKRALASFPRLQLCGAAYDGVGLPDCTRAARVAAQRLHEVAKAT